VGSPDYMSPEVTQNLNEKMGYGEEVDWWSLGCVFFEMLLGAPPFEGDTPYEIFENINKWKTIIPNLLETYSDSMAPECKLLLEGMLCEKEKRLGREINDYKNHVYFKDLDWDNLHDVEPPFVPNPPDTS